MPSGSIDIHGAAVRIDQFSAAGGAVIIGRFGCATGLRRGDIAAKSGSFSWTSPSSAAGSLWSMRLSGWRVTRTKLAVPGGGLEVEWPGRIAAGGRRGRREGDLPQRLPGGATHALHHHSLWRGPSLTTAERLSAPCPVTTRRMIASPSGWPER
jgi:hypothetical protein